MIEYDHVAVFKAVGRRRLLDLALILDTADAAHMRAGEPAYRQASYRHECRAPACALGHWAHHNPSRWGWEEYRGYPLPYLLEHGPDDTHSVHKLGEFGLEDEDEWDELFGGEGCGDALTARDAADYIRGFVTRKCARYSIRP